MPNIFAKASNIFLLVKPLYVTIDIFQQQQQQLCGDAFSLSHRRPHCCGPAVALTESDRPRNSIELTQMYDHHSSTYS
jgi:hypothetical protein